MSEHKSFFQKLKEKYDELCRDLGVDSGACRGCVPVVKFDPEQEKHPQNTKNKS